jgi:hypothetical protein
VPVPFRVTGAAFGSVAPDAVMGCPYRSYTNPADTTVAPATVDNVAMTSRCMFGTDHTSAPAVTAYRFVYRTPPGRVTYRSPIALPAVSCTSGESDPSVNPYDVVPASVPAPVPDATRVMTRPDTSRV